MDTETELFHFEELEDITRFRLTGSRGSLVEAGELEDGTGYRIYCGDSDFWTANIRVGPDRLPLDSRPVVEKLVDPLQEVYDHARWHPATDIQMFFLNERDSGRYDLTVFDEPVPLDGPEDLAVLTSFPQQEPSILEGGIDTVRQHVETVNRKNALEAYLREAGHDLEIALDYAELREDSPSSRLEDELDTVLKGIEIGGVVLTLFRDTYPGIQQTMTMLEGLEPFDTYHPAERFDVFQEIIEQVTFEQGEDRVVLQEGRDMIEDVLESDASDEVQAFLDDEYPELVQEIGEEMMLGEEEQSAVEPLQEAYEEWSGHISLFFTEYRRQEAYQQAASLVQEHTEGSYTAAGMYEFCRDTSLSHGAGVFLAAAANNLEEDRVVLPDLDGVNYVGYRNEKDLIVRGDVGSEAATTHQPGGTLLVEGDAVDWFAQEMEGGTAICYGDIRVGRTVAHEAFDGEVWVYGECEVSPEKGDTAVYTLQEKNVIGRLFSGEEKEFKEIDWRDTL